MNNLSLRGTTYINFNHHYFYLLGMVHIEVELGRFVVHRHFV